MCVGGTELCSAVAVSVSIGVALCAQLAGYLWGRVGILEVEVHMGGGVGGSPTVEDLGLSTLVFPPGHCVGERAAIIAGVKSVGLCFIFKHSPPICSPVANFPCESECPWK